MQMKVCYVINERYGKSYFTKIGIGFVNKDGSLNLKLNCIPVNGEIHVRDYVRRRGETELDFGTDYSGDS